MILAESQLQQKVNCIPTPYKAEAYYDLVTEAFKVMVFLYGNRIGMVSANLEEFYNGDLEIKLLNFISLSKLP